jgi:formylglycine-generating enzyme required for sulfatase activity
MGIPVWWPSFARDPALSVTPGSGETFQDRLADGNLCPMCPEMVVAPAGNFTMGSNEFDNEKPPHPVTIRQPFAVGKFEVTVDEWNACRAHGGCNLEAGGSYPGRGQHPATIVSWDEAKEYVAWIVKLTGKPYRLLTEVEWEYAARAGTTTTYFWGNDIGAGNANCNGCGSQWDGKQTAPVGSFKPNAFGLYDMHGNVWEWVEDCWHDSYRGVPSDGAAWTTACTDRNSRVLRGGSWYEGPQDLRAARRLENSVDARSVYSGFRLARTLNP